MKPEQIARAITEDIDVQNGVDTLECATTIVFRQRNGVVEVLLIVRGGPPEEGEWALPGGHMNQGEDRVQTAARETAEETGVQIPPEKWVYVATCRDNEKLIDHIFTAMVPGETEGETGSDAAAIKWVGLDQVPGLAFYHNKYLKSAFEKVGNENG